MCCSPRKQLSPTVLERLVGIEWLEPNTRRTAYAPPGDDQASFAKERSRFGKVVHARAAAPRVDLLHRDLSL